MSCEQGIRESRIDRSLTRSPLQNPNEHITAHKDAILNDLVPELPSFGGCENLVTAMDVFSRFLLHMRHEIQRPKELIKFQLTS